MDVVRRAPAAVVYCRLRQRSVFTTTLVRLICCPRTAIVSSTWLTPGARHLRLFSDSERPLYVNATPIMSASRRYMLIRRTKSQEFIARSFTWSETTRSRFCRLRSLNVAEISLHKMFLTLITWSLNRHPFSSAFHFFRTRQHIAHMLSALYAIARPSVRQHGSSIIQKRLKLGI